MHLDMQSMQTLFSYIFPLGTNHALNMTALWNTKKRKKKGFDFQYKWKLQFQICTQCAQSIGEIRVHMRAASNPTLH